MNERTENKQTTNKRKTQGRSESTDTTRNKNKSKIKLTILNIIFPASPSLTWTPTRIMESPVAPPVTCVLIGQSRPSRHLAPPLISPLPVKELHDLCLIPNDYYLASFLVCSLTCLLLCSLF